MNPSLSATRVQGGWAFFNEKGQQVWMFHDPAMGKMTVTYQRPQELLNIPAKFTTDTLQRKAKR